MISKELLSEVLGCDYCSLKYSSTTIHYEYEFDVMWSKAMQKNKAKINIYELAHKCKEWALTEGFIIYSSCKSASIYKDLEYLYGASNEPTEPEAVFKACQWILDNK